MEMGVKKPRAADLKASGRGIERNGWCLYWHPGRGVYVVRPLDLESLEGDEFTRLGDAWRELCEVARPAAAGGKAS